MNKRLRFLTAICFTLAAFFLLAVPVWADSVDEKIKALENELTRLKTEQMELKKDAVAAAAALPEFSYRPGSGLTIAAADKSWSMNFSWNLNTYMYSHPDGRPVITEGGERRATSMTSGQFTLRRNRPEWTFCWADCFYEMEISMDMAEGVGETVASARDNRVNFHFEKWNPFLPTLTVGTRIPGSIYLGRSSSSGFKSEHNLLIAGNDTTSTGSSSGINLFWEEVPVGTGDVSLFVGYRDRGVGYVLGDQRDTDRKGANLSFKARPFRQTKNQWLRGLELMVGSYLQPIDKRACTVASDPADDECGDDNAEPNRLRIRAHERIGRITLFDTGAAIGSGLHHYTIPSMRWVIGPYQLRANVGFDRWEGRESSAEFVRGVRGRNFEIENGLWLWSPKGLFTGSSSTANSLQAGWTFERVDVECAALDCDASPATGEFHRNRILYRELFLAYNVRAALRLMFWWGWYDTSNTPERTQIATGCKRNEAAVDGNAGRGCDFHTINLGLQFRF